MNIHSLFEAFVAALIALFEGIFTRADARDRKIAELEQRVAALESAFAAGHVHEGAAVPEPQETSEEDNLPWEDAPMPIPVPPMPEIGADTDGDIIVPSMPNTGVDADGDIAIPSMPGAGVDSGIAIPAMPETKTDDETFISAEAAEEAESPAMAVARFYEELGGRDQGERPNWDMALPDMLVTYIRGDWHWSLEERPSKAEAKALAQHDYAVTREHGQADSRANNVWTALSRQKLFPPQRWWELAKAMHDKHGFVYGSWDKAGEPESAMEPAAEPVPQPAEPEPTAGKLWNPKAGVVYRDTIRGAATWTTCWGTLPNGLEMTNIAQAVLVMELEHLQFHNKAVEWCDRSGRRKTDMFRGEKANDALAALHKWVRKNGSNEQKRLYKGARARCDAFVLDALRIKYMTGKNAAMTAALLATGDRCIMSPGEPDKYGPEIKRIDEQLMLIRAELRAELGC